MKQSQMRKALLAGCAITAVTIVSPFNAAFAQSAEPPVGPDQAKEATQNTNELGEQSSGPLQDIVVTARKRNENLRDVPVALTAMTGEALARRNITQMVDLVTTLPNLTVSYGTIQPRTFIRGFGSGDNLSFDQSVGKFVDNVSYGRDQDSRIPLFDMERVEVLRGPQVLLFGNSATAGALNITTRKPGNSFEADGSIGYEFNSNETNVQGGATLPIAEGASLRVAGLLQHLDKGWIKSNVTGFDSPRTRNYAGRAILHLDPNPDLKVQFKAEYDRLLDEGENIQVYKQSLAVPGLFDETKLDGRTSNSNSGAPFFQNGFAYLKNQTYQADINYQLLGGQLTSTTSYRKYMSSTSADGDGLAASVFNAFIFNRYRQFGQELRFELTSGDFDYTLGGYYQHDEMRAFTLIEFNLAPLGVPVPPFARYLSFDQNTDALSGFANVRWRVNSRLKVEAGFRYTDTRKDVNQLLATADIIPSLSRTASRSTVAQHINPALDPVQLAVLGVAPHDFRGIEQNDNYFQPQVIVQYEVARDNMVYAKFVSGSKAGGVDAISPANSPQAMKFGPEKATSFEIGAKGRLVGGRLDYALTVFSTTFKDLQLSVFDNISSFLVSNVGKARTRGVELELNWAPVSRLRVDLNGAYLDAKYLSFQGATCTNQQSLAVGPTCSQDLSGAPTSYASKWSGNLGVSYEQPVASDYRLAGRIDLSARSSYDAGSTNSPDERQKGYAQIDANLDFGPSSANWTISVFGRNLSNKRYLSFALPTIPATFGEMGTYSRGRQLGIRLSGRL